VSVEYRTLVQVPNIVDSDVDQARATLEGVKLSMTIEGATQQGTIESQDPEAGKRVDPGAFITVTVRPPVVLSPSSAVETPASNDEPTSASSAPLSPQQTDPVSTATPAETSVQSTVSSAVSTTASSAATTTAQPQLVTVPPLLGLRRADAEAVVATAGLGAEATGDLDGVIVEQIPAAGTEVPLGSIVTVGFESESNWWLPPLLVLIVVAGFAGGAYYLHQQRHRPRRPRWLSHHVSLLPDSRPGSRNLATSSHWASDEDIDAIPSWLGLAGLAELDQLDPEDFENEDHIISLVGNRQHHLLLLEENH